ncbi:MAG: hypothetical protein IKJ59_10070 [Clostridia bacterium]|nr:hypothetical protein [Clostridia bacterium]
MMLCICVSCDNSQESVNIISPPTLHSATATPETSTATHSVVETATPTAVPSVEPGMPDTLNFYIAEDGKRILVNSFSADWVPGKDIDCFEAITSRERTLSGKFTDIWNTAWSSYTNTKNVKIAYNLEINLKSGDIMKYDIKGPEDTEQNKDLIEVYLYDDVHVDGNWYSHLETSNMTNETIITSIKLTATAKQELIEKVILTTYLYTPDIPERIIASHTIDIINTSQIG